MAARRLKSDSPTPRRRPLVGNRYFKLILFSTWDHVLGPRIIRVWGESGPKRDDISSPRALVVEDDLVRAVATYSIDVTGETDDHDSILEKFFVLHQRSVVVSAFLIHVANPANPSDTKTFSLSFLLPYSELSEWLARRTFMENACRRIISRNLMIGLKEATTKQVSVCMLTSSLAAHTHCTCAVRPSVVQLRVAVHVLANSCFLLLASTLVDHLCVTESCSQSFCAVIGSCTVQYSRFTISSPD